MEEPLLDGHVPLGDFYLDVSGELVVYSDLFDFVPPLIIFICHLSRSPRTNYPVCILPSSIIRNPTRRKRCLSDLPPDMILRTDGLTIPEDISDYAYLKKSYLRKNYISKGTTTHESLGHISSPMGSRATASDT